MAPTPRLDEPEPLPPERSTAARLARLHLRTGALGLARAELETLAGTGPLVGEALVDLAEVRWRTGDLGGAGEAARAYLAGGGEAPVALAVAAEAAAALGRPGEARRLATRAIEASEEPLDRIFAGIPRSPVWPTDPHDPGHPAAALFPAEAGHRPGRSERERGPKRPEPEPPTPATASGAGPSLWDDPNASAAPATATPGEILDAAVHALAEGDRAGAALRLAVALRLDPALAPAVLDLASGGPGSTMDVVRGDALRAMGREAEARAAYERAAGALDLAADAADAADAAGSDEGAVEHEES